MPASPFVKPGFFTARVVNPLVGFLAGRLGLGLKGAQVLAVPGRKSGEWHRIPVNPLTFAGQRYLVAPRGETEWVRNMRVAGSGELRLGATREPIAITELADAEKPPILRAYVQKWWFEVARFFEGVTRDASLEELRRIAPGFPVFKIRPATRGRA